MKITYINTGNSVGNETSYVAPIVIPIAAGLKQELLFEGMETVKNMLIEVYRNETLVHQQRLIPSNTMRIDLSTFAQVLPSLNELFKGNVAGSNIRDTIRFLLLDGVTARTYTFYVCSLNCPYLNSRGWVHHSERNLVSTASASMVAASTIVTVSGTVEAVTDSVFGTGAKIKGQGAWLADLPKSDTTVPSGVEVTQAIYVDNVGSADFDLVFKFGSSQNVSERIPAGFRGRVSKSLKRNGSDDYEPYIWIRSSNAPMEANFYCFMMNYGSEPKPWIKAGANAASPCVGALTDYRSGKLLDTRQVVLSYPSTTNLDLVGDRRFARMYYPIGSDPAPKDRFYTLFNGGVGSTTTQSGDRFSEEDYNRIANPDGTVYGWMEYENKLPKDVSPDCGVLLRWLNSRGFIDSMFFEKYSIRPVMRTNNSGGNGIDYYETTVQIDVNWDNEPCLNWIQRSSDIIARIPIDVCQFGRATLLATNVFKTQGGNKTKTIQFKIKVQIVEP